VTRAQKAREFSELCLFDLFFGFSSQLDLGIARTLEFVGGCHLQRCKRTRTVVTFPPRLFLISCLLVPVRSRASHRGGGGGFLPHLQHRLLPHLVWHRARLLFTTARAGLRHQLRIPSSRHLCGLVDECVCTLGACGRSIVRDRGVVGGVAAGTAVGGKRHDWRARDPARVKRRVRQQLYATASARNRHVGSGPQGRLHARKNATATLISGCDQLVFGFWVWVLGCRPDIRVRCASGAARHRAR
jgi:hypothetical protein